MASNSTTSNPSTIVVISSNPAQNLITINDASQLPLKLTPLNYFSWKAQFNALFFGLDLLGNLDGTFPCPSPTAAKNGPTIPNPNYLLWHRQDQKVLDAWNTS